MINLSEVHEWVWENLEQAYLDTVFLKIESEGVYWYPVNVGKSWPFPPEGDEAKIECISTNEQKETPVGIFSCIVYRFIENDRAYLEMYMSPNIGIVAKHWDSEGWGFDWYLLKSYQIN